MAEIGARVAWKLAKALKGKSKPVTAKTGTATVTHVGSDGRLWVRLPGSSVDTPVNGVSTTEVSAGDSVSYSIDRGRLSVMGNSTSPSVSRSGATSIARSAVLPVERKADDAIADAERAKRAADEADSSAQRAMTSANAAGVAAAAAGESASAAHEAADSALVNLSVVEDVVGTLEWISEHGSFVATTDTEVVEGRVYFELSGGDYVPVAQPEGNPSENGWYVLDVSESQTEYVMAHLAVTSAGLWVLPSGLGTAQSEDMAPGYKALLTATGMHIYDASGNSVAFYGPTTRIGKSSTHHLELTDSSVAFVDHTGTIRPWQVKTDERYHRNPFSDSVEDLVTGVMNTIGSLRVNPWWMQLSSGSDLRPRPAFTIWRDVSNAVHMLFGKPYDPDAQDNAVRMELDADSMSISNEAGNTVFEISDEGVTAANSEGTGTLDVRSEVEVGNAFSVTEVGRAVEWEADQETIDFFDIELDRRHQLTEGMYILVYIGYEAVAGGNTYSDDNYRIGFLPGPLDARTARFSVPYTSYSSGVTLTYNGSYMISVESSPYGEGDVVDSCEVRILRVECMVDDALMPSFTYGTRSGERHGFDVAMGEGIEIWNPHQVALGRFNKPNNSDLFQLGWGTAYYRENVFSVDIEGNVTASGRVFTGNQSRLWVGGYHLIDTQTITLSQHVYEQPNGIVLVWSGYSGGQAQDYQWHFDYIPKTWVGIHDGSGFTCVMAGAGFNPIATKYVHIHEDANGSDTITGHANNNQSGTANGISYSNGSFVLREVWGV